MVEIIRGKRKRRKKSLKISYKISSVSTFATAVRAHFTVRIEINRIGFSDELRFKSNIPLGYHKSREIQFEIESQGGFFCFCLFVHSTEENLVRLHENNDKLSSCLFKTATNIVNNKTSPFVISVPYFNEEINYVKLIRHVIYAQRQYFSLNEGLS